MATFITVDYEESQLLERNRRQVDANRLEALEAQELEKLSRQIKTAVDSQDEIVAGRLRKRRREELAATVISKPERRACLVEVSGGFMTGPAPIEPLPAGYEIFFWGQPSTNASQNWNAVINSPYFAELKPSAVEFTKKEEYSQIGNLHFIYYSISQINVSGAPGWGYMFKKYYLLNLGKRRNDTSFGLNEYKKYSAIDLYVHQLSYHETQPINIFYYNPGFRFYTFNHLLINPTTNPYNPSDPLDPFNQNLLENWQPNRGPLSIDFPLTINLYPTKDAKAIDDAINGDGFEPIIQVATQKNWKQTAVKNYNWSAATTNPPPSSFPQTSFATVKANINKFEFLIT